MRLRKPAAVPAPSIRLLADEDSRGGVGGRGCAGRLGSLVSTDDETETGSTMAVRCSCGSKLEGGGRGECKLHREASDRCNHSIPVSSEFVPRQTNIGASRGERNCR